MRIIIKCDNFYFDLALELWKFKSKRKFILFNNYGRVVKLSQLIWTYVFICMTLKPWKWGEKSFDKCPSQIFSFSFGTKWPMILWPVDHIISIWNSWLWPKKSVCDLQTLNSGLQATDWWWDLFIYKHQTNNEIYNIGQYFLFHLTVRSKCKKCPIIFPKWLIPNLLMMCISFVTQTIWAFNIEIKNYNAFLTQCPN